MKIENEMDIKILQSFITLADAACALVYDVCYDSSSMYEEGSVVEYEDLPIPKAMRPLDEMVEYIKNILRDRGETWNRS